MKITLKTWLLTTILLLVGIFPPSTSLAESHWITGTAIGAGAGAATGTLAGYGISVPACDSQGECTRNLTLIGLGSGMIVGAGVGALIGTLIPKEQKVVALPLINAAGDNKVMGLSIGVDF